MKTKVTDTSITAFHDLGDTPETQRQRIAEWMAAETKAGRLVCIGSSARHFNMEKSTVSARMNEMKKPNANIQIDGRRYEMKFVKTGRDPVTAVTVEMWALVLLAQPQPEQLTLEL